MDKLTIISGCLFLAADIFAIASLANPDWINTGESAGEGTPAAGTRRRGGMWLGDWGVRERAEYGTAGGGPGMLPQTPLGRGPRDRAAGPAGAQLGRLLPAGRQGRLGLDPSGAAGSARARPVRAATGDVWVVADGTLVPGERRRCSAVRPGCCPRARRGTGSAERCVPRGPAEASWNAVEPAGEGSVPACVSEVQSPWTGNPDQSA